MLIIKCKGDFINIYLFPLFPIFEVPVGDVRRRKLLVIVSFNPTSTKIHKML